MVEEREPSLEQVIGLFDHLSRAGGDVSIRGTGDRELTVAGGPSRYLVSCGGEDYGAYNLVDPASAGVEGAVTLSVGGVPSVVDAAAAVGGELAERAIRYFYARGVIDPQLQ